MGCREMVPPRKIGSVGECRFNEEKVWPGFKWMGVEPPPILVKLYRPVASRRESGGPDPPKF